MNKQRDVWVYPDGDIDVEPEHWVRKGKCNYCGLCCELAHYMHYGVGRDKEEDAPPVEGVTGRTTTTWSTTKPLVSEHWSGYWTYWQRLPDHRGGRAPCSAYEGVGVCSVHEEEDRGELCRKWPIIPSDLDDFPECGFVFFRSP